MGWELKLLAIGGGLISGFMNSMVGGGGMISLPIFLMLGLPTATALGSNKVSSVLGAIVSSWTFIRKGKANGALLKRYLPFSFAGSVLGVALTQLFSSDSLRTLVIVMLFGVCLITLLKKDWGDYSTYRPLTGMLFLSGALFVFVMGLYDGFFGPGTGTFLIFGFLLVGFSFIESAANAQILNCASNIAACLAFIFLGAVNWELALTMAIGQIIGSIIGTRLAIAKGASWVRPIFIVISVTLIAKQIWTLFE